MKSRPILPLRGDCVIYGDRPYIVKRFVFTLDDVSREMPSVFLV